jgi:hypothetical protein
VPETEVSWTAVSSYEYRKNFWRSIGVLPHGLDCKFLGLGIVREPRLPVKDDRIVEFD